MPPELCALVFTIATLTIGHILTLCVYVFVNVFVNVIQNEQKRNNNEIMEQFKRIIEKKHNTLAHALYSVRDDDIS